MKSVWSNLLNDISIASTNALLEQLINETEILKLSQACILANNYKTFMQQYPH